MEIEKSGTQKGRIFQAVEDALKSEGVQLVAVAVRIKKFNTNTTCTTVFFLLKLSKVLHITYINTA